MLELETYFILYHFLKLLSHRRVTCLAEQGLFVDWLLTWKVWGEHGSNVNWHHLDWLRL